MVLQEPRRKSGISPHGNAAGIAALGQKLRFDRETFRACELGKNIVEWSLMIDVSFARGKTRSGKIGLKNRRCPNAASLVLLDDGANKLPKRLPIQNCDPLQAGWHAEIGCEAIRAFDPEAQRWMIRRVIDKQPLNACANLLFSVNMALKQIGDGSDVHRICNRLAWQIR
jgi:hypothetical protein